MMKASASYILSFLFGILSLTHIYWATGGTQGLAAAIPTSTDGTALLAPTPLMTLFVALILLGLALFYNPISRRTCSLDSKNWARYIGWGIPIFFLLRAIGDFRYVGFFKRVTDTSFSAMDTSLYSPLCVTIAILAWMAARE